MRKPIDENLLKSAQVRGSIAYAQLPKNTTVFNSVPYYLDDEMDSLLKEIDEKCKNVVEDNDKENVL